jgi:hypothetical protein
MVSDDEGAVGTTQLNRMAHCISFNSFSTLSYSSSRFVPYLYKMSLDTSSISPWIRPMSSSMSVASIWGLLARVFFLAEGFCRETFLFFDAFVSVGDPSVV